ncbi:hypothetical protein HZY91_02935 [Facklamia sp. DSM 111018]|uniref:Bacterial Ig domain-containing protein n=1 Tax=Facklamia lactis TaxID=2749967 RepID=A0ABS0LR62_9LACT|nr:hypothetical protein [Facklamia lactis]
MLSPIALGITNLEIYAEESQPVYIQTIHKQITINAVAQDDTSVSGTAGQESTVTVQFSDSNKETVDADSDGNWSVNVPQGSRLKNGDIVKATTGDKKGNIFYEEVIVGADSNAQAELKNNKGSIKNNEAKEIATSTSETSAVKDSEISKESKAQINFVKVNTVFEKNQTINGTSTPNATVLVFFDKTCDKEVVTANDKGEWTINVPSTIQLAKGDLLNVTSNSATNEQAFQQVKVQVANPTNHINEK